MLHMSLESLGLYLLPKLNNYTCSFHSRKYPALDVKFYSHPRQKKKKKKQPSNVISESQLYSVVAKWCCVS